FIFFMIMVTGIAAIAVDAGLIVWSRASLRHAVDSAALAGASQLIGFVTSEEQVAARAEAEFLAACNPVANDPLNLADSDIVFGRYHQSGSDWIFTESGGNDVVDSIKVTGRRTADSPDGPVQLTFTGMFGGPTDFFLTAAEAVATQPRRYVMFVMDRSGSMQFDTPASTCTYYYAPSTMTVNEQTVRYMEKSPSGWYYFPYTASNGSTRKNPPYFYALHDDGYELNADSLVAALAPRVTSGSRLKYINGHHCFTFYDTNGKIITNSRQRGVGAGWLYVPGDLT
ncbi:MAG: hypothetical protein GY700_16920, partial [Propionibacteriaceae bacterium]|nr:hypothetical protein [Propionibacteriaceae bacterium]